MLLVPIFQGLSQNTHEGNAWALFYMVLAILTDFLDGFIARKLNQITDLGKLLDPLADKVTIIGVYLILALPIRESPLPFWFLLVLFIRDMTILTCGYFIYRKRKIVVKSNIWGKSTSTMLAAMLVSYVLNLTPTTPWLFWIHYKFLLWLALSFIAVSGISYGWRFYQLCWGQAKTTRSSMYKAKDA
jgi:CDP-diacylglycerol--glycerol-3-phosphate 3-phosphatidyltransferase